MNNKKNTTGAMKIHNNQWFDTIYNIYKPVVHSCNSHEHQDVIKLM